MPSALDTLPSWIAHPLARARPLEDPDAAARRAPLTAWVELAVVRVLAQVSADAEQLPFTLEAAMRLAMGDEMDAEAWADLYASFDHTGHTAILGLPDPLDALIGAACAAAGSDAISVVGLLSALEDGPEAGPELVDAAAALTAACPALVETPLTWVREVRELPDGGAGVVARTLVGTAFPELHMLPCEQAPPVEAGTLCFWDGADRVVNVPDWLAQWSEELGVLRLYAGRDDATRRWLLATRYGAGRTWDAEHPMGTPPVFLAEPTWTTPPPNAVVAADGLADTKMLTRPFEVKQTSRMAVDRVDVPPTQKPAAEPSAGHIPIVRVMAGRYLMRYARLEQGKPVVVGRNQAASTLVLPHHQLSRRHTQVTCGADGTLSMQDLGSTNGSLLNGAPVPAPQIAEIRVGDILSVGPVLLRVELADEARIARLDHIDDVGSSPDNRRDPLTGLLVPRHLIDELPESLRGSFREGAPAPAAPPLWGVLLYIDRLAAVHAQHGERVADEVFIAVTRIVKYAVDHPERCARVGYGEILVPLVGADQRGAVHVLEELKARVQDQVWDPPIKTVTARGAIGRKAPEQAASAWLQQVRRELQASRFRR